MAETYKNDRADIKIADIQRVHALIEEFRTAATKYQTVRGFGKPSETELAETAKTLVEKAREIVDLANNLNIVRKRSMQSRGLWASKKMMADNKSTVVRHIHPETGEFEEARVKRTRLEFSQDVVSHVERFSTQLLLEWTDTTGTVKPPGYVRSKDRIWLAAKISDPKPKVA